MPPITARLRRAVLCLVAAMLLAPVPALAQSATPAATPGATPTVTAAPLDLAAMALTPADLDGLGLDGFLVADGRTQTLADRVAEQAVADGTDPAAIDVALSGLGWVRGYRARLAHPIAPGEETFDALISSGVTQFTDADGARSAYDLTSRIDVRDGNATPVAGRATLGDRSILLDVRPETFDDGTAHPGLRLLLQHGTLLGDVIVFEAPDRPLGPAEIEALAARLLERMETILASGGPGLSPLVLRVDGSRIADPDLDNYMTLEGETFTGLGDTADDIAATAAEYRGATGRYRYVAAISDTLFQYTTVAQFPDADLAAAWVQGASDRFAADLPPGGTVEEVADAPVFGDASVVLALTAPTGDTEALSYGVLSQVGDRVISQGFVSLGPLDLADVLTVADAQLACFLAGDCTAAAPPPPGFGM